jgi:hypothetical protein
MGIDEISLDILVLTHGHEGGSLNRFSILNVNRHPKMKTTRIYLVTAFLFVALSASADDRVVDPTNPFLPALHSVTAIELPQKAADLVKHADDKAIQQTTVDVVKAAVGLNPAAGGAIVASIAKSSPKMAAIAAGTAVRLVPDQAASIARAAAAAAPKEARNIVEAVCRAVPADYTKVAIAVAEVVPGASREILEGVAAAIPQLKDLVNQVLAAYNSKAPPMSTALAQISKGADSASLAQAPIPPSDQAVFSRAAFIAPAVQKPTTPASQPGPLNPGDTPSGHRGYASP